MAQSYPTRATVAAEKELHDDHELQASIFEIEKMKGRELEYLLRVTLECRRTRLEELLSTEDRYRTCVSALDYYEAVGHTMKVEALLRDANLFWQVERVERLGGRPIPTSVRKTLIRIDAILGAWKASIGLRFLRLDVQ